MDERTTYLASLQYILHDVNSIKLGCQHTKAPLAFALRPFWANFTHPTHNVNDVMCCVVLRLTTPPGSTSPILFEQWCGFFYFPQEPDMCKCCETGPGFSSLSEKTRKSNHLQISLSFTTKTALSSQFFKDPECWSGRGSNPQPSAQQTGALPTELTRF